MISALQSRFPCFFSISKRTVLFACAIVVAASFMRQVYRFVHSILPPAIISFGIWLGFLAAIGAALVLLYKRPHILGVASLVLTAGAATGLAFSMGLIEERVHILTYGFLASLATRDLRRWPVLPRSQSALFFCVLVGCIDELFQALLPYRVGDVRDVLFDSVSAVLGIILTLSLPKA